MAPLKIPSTSQWKLALMSAIYFSAIQTISAQEIVAVMSSDSGHYREAFEGFQEGMGYPIHVVNLQKEKLEATKKKLVVAFGGKAALEEFRQGASVIACMAPGIELKRGDAKGSFVYIEMAPRAGVLFSKLKELQPSLKRLAIFWSSDSMKDYIRELGLAASSAGIELTTIEIEDSSYLPKRLRDIRDKVDALLLPPDPSLVNQQNFTTVKDFSWDNHIPFYVPTEGLVEMGGTASVSSSFKEIGRAAAKVAQNILQGTTTEGTIYPDKVEIALNVGVAKNANLQISPELLQKVDKVFK